ncbi:TIM barrel protein [Candidatus Woesearchaeota archaeon]|nr:TIM barrel protein [Candidatus Woesearchaeota archaeon]
MIRIGPAGTAGMGYPAALEEIKKHGLSALEVEFTYGVRMARHDAEEIGNKAAELGITLSVHAPYYINLASSEKDKVQASVKRILDSCEKAELLGARYVVFHAGFYQDKTAEETYSRISEQIDVLHDKIKENSWKVRLAPEVTGKPSQFGSLNELLMLRKDTGCHLTIDFAHLKARQQGAIDYQDVIDTINKAKPKLDHIHSHFSGIEWTEKGEKRHIITSEDAITPFLESVFKNRLDITIINESPEPFDDCLKMKDILSHIRQD